MELKCDIISGASGPSFFYKVSWLYTGKDSSAQVVLVELDQTGLLRYPENMQGRLRLSRPTQSSFYLGIQRAHEGDSGTYQCQVEQYQLDHEGLWQQKASDSAGTVTLTVNVTGMIFKCGCVSWLRVASIFPLLASYDARPDFCTCSSGLCCAYRSVSQKNSHFSNSAVICFPLVVLMVSCIWLSLLVSVMYCTHAVLALLL